MLRTVISGVEFKNPLIMASGTFGYGKEFTPYVKVSELGGISCKGLTLNPKQGNYGPRIWETASGMLNSVGLQNPGVKEFIKKELPIMNKLGTVIIANLGGGSLDDYVEGARLLDDTNIAMIELNISCPNVKEGGMAFGMDPNRAKEVVSAVKKASSKPLMVKLSPNAPSIVEVAKACEEAGADSLSLINTVQGMVIDLKTGKPMFRNITAGLSGPAIMPIALRMVYDVCKTVKIPVVGLGGISSGEDVVQFIMAGATAVQIGTANLARPDASTRILKELEEYMHEHNIKNLEEIRGIAHNL